MAERLRLKSTCTACGVASAVPAAPGRVTWQGACPACGAAGQRAKRDRSGPPPTPADEAPVDVSGTTRGRPPRRQVPKVKEYERAKPRPDVRSAGDGGGDTGPDGGGAPRADGQPPPPPRADPAPDGGDAGGRAAGAPRARTSRHPYRDILGGWG